MKNERIKMTVQMDVTPAQGLALKAMFKEWNALASMGASRKVAFFVDGDGNFKPDCQVVFHGEVPELTPELRKAAMVENKDGNSVFDFDSIAWKLRPDYKPPKENVVLLNADIGQQQETE